MSAKKDDDKKTAAQPKDDKAKAEALLAQAPAAHEPTQANNPQVPMDPDVEARRSGPPPGAQADPMPAAPVPGPAPMVSDAEGDRNSAFLKMIDELLKDPTFDTSGVYRERLAKLSMMLPGKPYPPTTDVDVHGDPQGAEPQR